jgi:hypothetical protein
MSCVGEMRTAHKILVGKSERMIHTDGMTVLKES